MMTKTTNTFTNRPFCCTTDVVTRKLPPTANIKCSKERLRLLKLAEDDQKERASDNFLTRDEKELALLLKRETLRAQEALAILRKIRTPSRQNIGLDGSRAMWLIALHNPDYHNLGKAVLVKMQSLYYRDKNSVFYPGIPYLADRLRLMRRGYKPTATQLYGTQASSISDHDGRSIQTVFPILREKEVSLRRSRYDLLPIFFNSKGCVHATKQP